MELTNEDKQRIKQASDRHIGNGMSIHDDRFISGAEYATIYEREKQAEQAQDQIDSDHIQIKQLEAERTELKEVIQLALNELNAASNLIPITSDTITRLENSLKK